MPFFYKKLLQLTSPFREPAWHLIHICLGLVPSRLWKLQLEREDNLNKLFPIHVKLNYLAEDRNSSFHWKN
jgi:hypothetical protein